MTFKFELSDIESELLFVALTVAIDRVEGSAKRASVPSVKMSIETHAHELRTLFQSLQSQRKTLPLKLK